MSPQFTPARSDAIRAGLIEHVGRDTNRGHAPNPSVIERDGEVMLCLEGQAQSLPPWCAGAVAVLEGWEWGSIPHRELNGVRFTEDYVTVRGALRKALSSGVTRILVLTEPAAPGRLAPTAAPAVGPAPSGLSDAELDAILHEDLTDTIGPGTLSVVDGVIVARVAYDDGTVQSVVDRQYGRGVFHIVPLLQPQ